MPKVWKIAAATWMALFIIAGQAHAAERFTPAKRHAMCRYESWSKNNGFTDAEVRMTIDCAVDHFPTSRTTAHYVANRESGLECRAANPYSSAGGVYQVVSGTWASWWSSIRPRFDGWKLRNNRYLCRANVLISIAAAHRWGWGPWSM